MSVHSLTPLSSRSTIGEERISRDGPVSFLFDYTLDFGREQTIIISRVQEPSEIPRPADYLEILPVAYYLSVDPRYRLVLLTPAYDTVAAVSFASFKTPIIEVQEPLGSSSDGNFSSPNKSKYSAKIKGQKTRFVENSGAIVTWEYRAKEDVFDLWVSEKLVEPLSPTPGPRRLQTRKVGCMRRTQFFETGSKRVVIEANTRYIGEVAMLASALAVLKKDALEEKRRKIPTAPRRLSLPFVPTLM